MASTFSVGGLASGLDTQSILDQLIALERQPITLLENRKSQYQTRLDEWGQITSKLQALKTSMDDIRQSIDFNIFTTNSEDEDILTLSATTSAAAGEHSIVVQNLAQARKITSKTFSSTTDALNLSGDFLIDQNEISISTSDNLLDIVDKINNSNADVTASILQLDSNQFRLILASDKTGVDSFHILDASTTNVLQGLGIITGTVAVKNAVTGGAESDSFTDITTTIGGLLSLSTALSGTVTINDRTINLDLQNDTLSDIRDKINAAAPTGVVASIITTTENSNTVYKLRIEGTTSFLDDNNVLQTLGVLEGATGSAAIAQVITGNIVNTSDGNTAITAATKFSEIYGANVANGDTIKIVGIDHAGGSVNSTFTITNSESASVQDLLTAIETAFSGNVTATINSAGKIVVTDDTTGVSDLDLALIENNEGGGSLNFGTFSVTTTGQNVVTGDVQAGEDTLLEVDGVSITRSSNAITDILTGVSLNLHKEDETKTVNFSVSRDYDAMIKKIQDFTKTYNDIVNSINQEFNYDQENKTSGTLLGDTTLISVQSEIRNIISNRIAGLPQGLRSLAQIGIDSDRKGIISLDQSKFMEKIQDDFVGVTKIFAAVGETTDTDFSYISHSKDTKAGSYAVNITQAATQATVIGTTSLLTGITDSEVLTFTDHSTEQSSSITLNAGEDIDEIVSKINSELAQEYQQVRTSSGTLLTGGVAANAATAWTAIDGGASVGDTFTIAGINHDGDAVSGTYTIASSDTVQNLLSEIQTVFDNSATVTINNSGKIVVTDVDSGTSQMAITITANNEGSGSVDLGNMDLTQSGRYSLAITAANEGGHLKLTHDDYGLGNGFSITQSANYLGMTDGEFLGQDVAGTINGENTTGSGQVLTGNSDQPNINGLVLRITLTPEQLMAQGADQGVLNLTMGVAEQMYNHLTMITDQYNGYVANRQENIQDTIDDIQERIDLMEIRVAKKQSNLEAQFVTLERSLAQLNSLGIYLTSQLSGL